MNCATTRNELRDYEHILKIKIECKRRNELRDYERVFGIIHHQQFVVPQQRFVQLYIRSISNGCVF